MVERQALIGEIANDQAFLPRLVEVGGVGAHASALFTCIAIGHASLYGDVGKCSIVVVAVELVWLGIIGDKKVDPAIVIDVDQCNSERFARGVVQPGLLGDIFEDAIAFVVEEGPALALVEFRRAIGLVPRIQGTDLVRGN